MSDALATDLYEVNMALAYLDTGMTGTATFSLFVRHLPPDRGFLVAAGLESALDHLASFRVDDEDVAAFADALGRPPSELEPLRGLRFSGDAWAVPEGRILFPDTPLLEVTAPMPEAQLVETHLLNQLSHQSAQASKAARCILVAGGRQVVDFSLRRCQGLEAGLHAARAGAVVGFAATSNVAAAARYGIPATGTMAHSFVEAFDEETEAFRAFAGSTSGPVTLLVDTYDTARGVDHAVEVLRGLPDVRRIGVRLDSGDLAELAHAARRVLDREGLPQARIVASGGLDEYAIEAFVAAGVPIDVFAVGTKVGTSADTPYLDAAYKLVEYDGRPVMKLSTEKVSEPGAKQVFRQAGLDDVLGTRDEPAPAGSEPLLLRVIAGGRRVTPRPSEAEAVAAARKRFRSDLEQLDPSRRRLRGLPDRRIPRSATLARRTEQVRAELRGRA
ncbi:nicotinate phosphoribosyltransferase [Nocardioides koreensis]|uniref:Nicotinate phosphoribosyltransferase n=1 Tax=Nocardioides koreensis TaxID=433651 RepID=A0ABP5LCC0_9ACTN